MAGNLSASVSKETLGKFQVSGDEDVSVQVAQVVQVSGVSTTQKQTRTQHET